MPRIVPALRLLAVCVLLAAEGAMAHAQGISGVTRRTPTLEKQAVARRFFDAAGLPTAGAAAANSSTPATRGLPLATKPAPSPSPALATRGRVNLPPVSQRPFLAPAPSAGTAARITSRPSTVPHHVAPRSTPSTP
ncbi:MAG: hypothetical protein IT580_11270 [Verrucomicrobiales bacterium]|nr:hypothetical protein [Verrucomicrobiales bacterium]